METQCRCHSCGTEVNASTRRCPCCYVALEAACRAPSPLRAAPSAAPSAGPLAPAAVPVADEQPLPDAIRCPACETTVTPVTGWCSYCMEPLPFGGADSDQSIPDQSIPDQSIPVAWDFGDFEYGGVAEAPGGQVIVGPWVARPVGVTYATWRRRAVAALIDASVFVPPLVAMAFNVVVGSVLLVATVAFSAWQICCLQGRTGQTIGKNRVGIFLVRESNLAPIGPRRAGLRQLAHGIDAALLGVGYLWPLWDAKHQTFADQLFATVVVSG